MQYRRVGSRGSTSGERFGGRGGEGRVVSPESEYGGSTGSGGGSQGGNGVSTGGRGAGGDRFDDGGGDGGGSARGGDQVRFSAVVGMRA